MIGDYMSFSETYRELGVSDSWLYKRTSKKLIKHYRINGKIFFSKKDLEQEILNGIVKPASELQADAFKSLTTTKKHP